MALSKLTAFGVVFCHIVFIPLLTCGAWFKYILSPYLRAGLGLNTNSYALKLMSLIFVLAIVTSAGAVTYPGLGIEYWAGDAQGQNEATVVVDFGFEQYAFGYRWDGAATGWDALNSIGSVVLENKLDVVSTDYGAEWGMLIEDLSYLDAVKFDYGEFAFAGWAYFNSSDGTNWTAAGGSCSFRNLSSGDWDCYNWSEFDMNPPYGPLRLPGEQPVPEPVSLALLGLGGLLVRWRKR